MLLKRCSPIRKQSIVACSCIGKSGSNGLVTALNWPNDNTARSILKIAWWQPHSNSDGKRHCGSLPRQKKGTLVRQKPYARCHFPPHCGNNFVTFPKPYLNCG